MSTQPSVDVGGEGAGSRAAGSLPGSSGEPPSADLAGIFGRAAGAPPPPLSRPLAALAEAGDFTLAGAELALPVESAGHSLAHLFKEHFKSVIRRLKKQHPQYLKEFGRPVLEDNTDLTEMYSAAVHEPMDLRTLAERVEAGVFPVNRAGCEEFVRQLRLIGTNCLAFQQSLEEEDRSEFYSDLAQSFLGHVQQHAKGLWEELVRAAAAPKMGRSGSRKRS